MYLTPGFFESHRRWPVAWALGVPLLLIAIDLTPLEGNLLFFVMGMPALMGAWAIVAVVAVVKATQAAVRRQWKRVALTAVLPVTVVCVALNFWTFAQFCRTSADLLYWLVMRPFYVADIRRTPTNGLPRVFLRTSSGRYSNSWGYVYDESDQIMSDGRSAEWNASVDQSPLACPFGAEPIPGPGFLTRHWYSFSSEC
jgi:hypothetical protein